MIKALTIVLKIAIVGMGVAGSYLACRLSSRHEVVGFERFTREKFDCICAWGTSKYGIRPYVEKCGLDFDDYIFHEGKTMYVKYGSLTTEVPLTGLVTFDKHRLVKDMQKKIKIKFGIWVRNREELGDFDLVIDATAYRVLLPRVIEEILVPSVQYSLEYDDVIPYNDFYIEILEGMGGYLWYFPLTKRKAHVGAGDVNHRHLKVLRRFFSKHPGRRTKIVGRPIRICPPSMCEPIYQDNTVGVGESIGAVFPLLGEGIIPTLQCSELLIQNLDDLESYRRQVHRKFHIYDVAYNFVKSNIRGRFVFPDYLIQMSELARHVMNNELRYGYNVSPVETLLKTHISAG